MQQKDDQQVESEASLLSVNVQAKTNKNSDVTSSFEGALLGSEGLATNSNEEVEEKQDITIAAQSEQLAEMRETSKEDIKEAQKYQEKQRKEQAINKKKETEEKNREK